MATREELLTQLSDCKTTDRYIVRSNGDIYLIFGLATEVVLAHKCYFRDDKLYYSPLCKFAYDEVSRVCTATIVKGEDGNPIEATEENFGIGDIVRLAGSTAGVGVVYSIGKDSYGVELPVKQGMTQGETMQGAVVLSSDTRPHDMTFMRCSERMTLARVRWYCIAHGGEVEL